MGSLRHPDGLIGLLGALTRVQSADLIGSKLLPEVNDGVGSVHADREIVHDGCDPFP